MPKSMDIDEGRAMARGLRAHVDRKKVVEARTALDAGEDATAIEREAGNRCERATGRVECDGERSCADETHWWPAYAKYSAVDGTCRRVPDAGRPGSTPETPEAVPATDRGTTPTQRRSSAARRRNR